MTFSAPLAYVLPQDWAFDVAETFAQLASLMREEPPQRLEMSRWRGDPEVQGATDELRTQIIDTGTVTEDQLRQALRGPRETFTMLRAIDQAFATLDPYVGSRNTGRLGQYRRTFHKLARYNQDGTLGSVIPRRSFPTRPQQVPDHEAEYLHSLMLLSSPPKTVRFNRLAPELDFSEKIRKRATLVVGCVPFLRDLDELEIRRIEDADAWYAIRARTGNDGWAEHWQQRIILTLANLDRSNAHIGVLPELALTDEMLAWWQNTLLRIPPPEGSRLEWILVGTGPITESQSSEQQPNRAVLLHRATGEIILWQDKCEPFTLTDQHIKDWQLGPYLTGGTLAEWMREGKSRNVIDTRVGRLAILICEDHVRLLTVGAELASVAPTHLIIPIFAPPILRYRWQEQAAEKFANTTGSASVVVTSYAVKPTRRPRAHPRKRGQIGTALALMPTQRGPSKTWSAKTRIGDAEGDPVAVVRFVLPRS
jgi:predicted amidohydrolase